MDYEKAWHKLREWLLMTLEDVAESDDFSLAAYCSFLAFVGQMEIIEKEF